MTLKASMRPGDFSPGNARRMARASIYASWRFNEAGGFLPRKHRAAHGCITVIDIWLQ